MSRLWIQFIKKKIILDHKSQTKYKLVTEKVVLKDNGKKEFSFLYERSGKIILLHTEIIKVDNESFTDEKLFYLNTSSD